MTVLHIDPESLAGRVISHLKEGEGHPMRTDLIARSFDVSPRMVHTQLADVVARMVLKRDKDQDDEYTYRRGPQFKMAMLDGKPEPVVTAAPAASARRIPVRGTLLQEGEGIVPAATSWPGTAPTAQGKPLTPETVGIRKGIPMPGRRTLGADWSHLFPRLTEAGDSTDPLPKNLRATLGKLVTNANKVENGPRFALRTIDAEHIGVWRTA